MNTASWQTPPMDVLGSPVPIHLFVARTDDTVVALRHVTAFPEGCVLSLHVAVRRGSLNEPAWKRLSVSRFGADPELAQADDDLKLGVRFPDGSKATTVDHPFHGWSHPTDRPEPPMLVETESGSSSSDQLYHNDLGLWLWPLPPPGSFEFVVEWQAMGIGITSATLEGGTIIRAAEHAIPYWPAS